MLTLSLISLQTNRFIDVDFNCLDANVNLQTWVVLLDFLGMGAKIPDVSQLEASMESDVSLPLTSKCQCYRITWVSQPVNVVEMGKNGECNRNRIKLMITYSEIKIFSSIVHMTVMEKKPHIQYMLNGYILT